MIEDKRDFIGGMLLIAAGLAVAIYAYANYALGTVQRMGPGMFPFGAGMVMAAIGVLVLIPAFLRPSTEGSSRMPLKPFVLITLSVIAFALITPRFGLVPAIVVLVMCSSLADKRFNIVHAAALAVGMCVLSWLIFILGLNLPLTLFRWPL